MDVLQVKNLAISVHRIEMEMVYAKKLVKYLMVNLQKLVVLLVLLLIQSNKEEPLDAAPTDIGPIHAMAEDVSEVPSLEVFFLKT